MKVSLMQMSYRGSKDKMVKDTKKKIKELAKEGSELIVLQELHQSEYFCKSEDVKYFEYAQSFEEDIKFWAKVSKKYNIVLVTSLFEKRAPGLYHNTAVVFDKGEVAGKYRKMHIPDDPGFYEKFYFTPGDLGFEPIETSVGKLGVLICWDQWFVEAARVMALKGAEILIYPTAIGWFDGDDEEEKKRQLDAWITIQRAHAIANGLPLVSCNRCGFEEDPSGVIEGIRFWGNSFIVGPQGEFLAKANEKEQTLTASIDLNRTKEVRDIWPFFRDRRVEHYSCLQKIFCDKE
ncbi:MAG: carbon-nitrogen hydrolase [Epsilonproteobacteria bacterium]|nr:carbon-nitrogen hydrolase [Campylobacterota bacterium]